MPREHFSLCEARLENGTSISLVSLQPVGRPEPVQVFGWHSMTILRTRKAKILLLANRLACFVRPSRVLRQLSIHNR